MEVELLLRLLLAHVVGDFYLQRASWITDRREKHARSAWLYLHGVVHGLLAWVALGELTRWKEALCIASAHVVVDLVKSYVDRHGRSAAWFLIDQALHVAVLVFVVNTLSTGGVTGRWSTHASAIPLLAIVLAALGITRPVGFFVQAFTSRWDTELGERTDNLPGAGMWIGIIERLLVLVFVLIGAVEAVGFLLAAKSVFRFGDLRDSTDRKRTEYVLVGTLLSFAIAFVAALCARRLVLGAWA